MKGLALFVFTCASLPGWAAKPVTFHKDVEPVLQRRCQGCHRPGEIAPMSFLTYGDTRPWAKAIRSAVLQKKMPPWFADPAHGTFLNERTLSNAEIAVLTSWADAGAPEGNPKDAPKPMEFVEGWRIGQPDVVIEIPKAFNVPATGMVPYQYISVPTGFTEDKWVQAVEIRPGNRRVVHHIIASSGPPARGLASKTAKASDFFTLDIEKARNANLKPGEEPTQFSSGTDSEMLQVFVPGGDPPMLQPGQARLVKAGSNLVFQLHYTTTGKPEQDRTRIGFIFAKQPPRERIKGILAFNTHFTIPAGAPNHLLSARTEILHEVRMVSMLPHAHLRGKDFQYRAIYPSGESEVLLSVPKYDFNWQINYYLTKPKLLPKGTILEFTGHYDNSPNNPYNPDPKTDVHYGEQTWEEMLNGFMEVSMEPVTSTPEILGPAPAAVSFHKDVLPILQARCQGCHRPGETAPMALLTYAQARPWAKAIRAAVLAKKMPPWFAEPGHAELAGDRRLSTREVETLTAWADAGAPEGNPKDAPKPLEFTEGWSIGTPDLVVRMAKGFTAPASGSIPYQYILMPTGLTEDRWVEAAEVRPGNRAIVHHVIAFALDPKKSVMARGKLNDFLDAEAIARAVARKPGAPEPNQFSSGTDSEALSVFVPGFVPAVFEPHQARLLKAGSVILFQMHYTTAGQQPPDFTSIGLRFARQAPRERVKMVNVQNFAFTIPPNVDNYPIEARARLTRDVTLLSLQPHMHLRGKSFEYRATYPNGESEVLLRIPRWDFNWQLSYVLAKPKLLPKGTVLEVIGMFDNSRNNHFNPDPNAEVLYGEQTWNEMLGGLMDFSISPEIGDPEFFEPVVKKAAPASTVAGVKR